MSSKRAISMLSVAVSSSESSLPLLFTSLISFPKSVGVGSVSLVNSQILSISLPSILSVPPPPVIVPEMAPVPLRVKTSSALLPVRFSMPAKTWLLRLPESPPLIVQLFASPLPPVALSSSIPSPPSREIVDPPASVKVSAALPPVTFSIPEKFTWLLEPFGSMVNLS